MASINFLSTKSVATYETIGGPKVIKYNEILPFRVRFSSIGIPGVQGLVPPIGIAIIGVNNYIL